MEKFLDQHADTYFIAENAQMIIGSGGYHFPTKSCGRLSWYLIKSEYQSQGIGGILVHHALQKLETYPITALEVWTSQYADRFFAKFGFTTELVVQNYWAAGIHLYKMTKKPF